MRIRAFLISEEMLLYFLASGTWHFEVNSEIPIDAKIHAITLDAMVSVVRIVLRHDSFAEVNDGDLIPIGMPPTVKNLSCI